MLVLRQSALYNNVHPLYARTLSDGTIPARKSKNVPSIKCPMRFGSAVWAAVGAKTVLLSLCWEREPAQRESKDGAKN